MSERLRLFDHLRPFRLPPAGGFLPPRAVMESLNIHGRDDSSSRLKQALVRFSGMPVVAVCRSGKESLYRLFSSIKEGAPDRSFAAMSAYTCPDVAAAAVRAGMHVLPLDIDLRTLEPCRPAERSSEIAAVVLTNPYGLTDPTDQWEDFCKSVNAVLIDDACQSALSELERRRSDWTVLSFGRGKALAGIGGGALLSGGTVGTPHACSRSCGFSDADTDRGRVPAAARLAFALLMYMFEHPRLYWIPASLPFLRLGETTCDLDFKCGALGRAEQVYANAVLCRAFQRRELLKRTALCWHDAIRSAGLSGTVLIEPMIERRRAQALESEGFPAPIRYPVIFPDEKFRDAALHMLVRFGASSSYPCTLQRYRELSGSVVDVPTPHADEVSRRILTLPVHRFVTAAVIEKTVDIIRGLQH